LGLSANCSQIFWAFVPLPEAKIMMFFKSIGG